MKTSGKLFLGVGAAIGLGYGIRSMRRANFRKIWRDSWADTGNRYGPGDYEWVTLDGKYGQLLTAPVATKKTYHVFTNDALLPEVVPGETWRFYWMFDGTMAPAQTASVSINWVLSGTQTGAVWRDCRAKGMFDLTVVVPAGAAKFRWHNNVENGQLFVGDMKWEKVVLSDKISNQEYIKQLYRVVLKRECEWDTSGIVGTSFILHDGKTREQWAEKFVSSPEAQSRGLGKWATPPITAIDAMALIPGA